MSQSNPLVEEQYSQWVYPEPIVDIAEWKAIRSGAVAATIRPMARKMPG